jgi:hypothetical protein
MKTSLLQANLIKTLIASNNGSKQNKAKNVGISQKRIRFNLA